MQNRSEEEAKRRIVGAAPESLGPVIEALVAAAGAAG